MSDCCCSKPSPAASTAPDLRDTVRDGYAKIAEAGSLGAISGGCCGAKHSADELAAKIGYSAEEIRALPEGANMGLSCGNPAAIAALRPGEVVLDLGSGGGFDAFLAGPKVGPSGRVIGVDMTPQMLQKARRNIDSYRKSSGLDNVEFRLGEIEHLPVADASVDVVISNCVINLSPDKPRVWREIARVLKPGGRVAASDMALLRPLPDSLKQLVEAMVGCVAGAVLLDEYRQMVFDAGLVNVDLRPKPQYTAALADLKDPLYAKIVEALPAGTTLCDLVTSVDVTAQKKSSCCCKG